MKQILSLLILFGFYVEAIAQNWDLLEEIAPTEALESDYGVNMVFADDKLVVAWPRIFTRGVDADNCGEIITYTQDTEGKYQELARISAADLVGSCQIGDGFGYGLAYDNGKLAIGMPAGARAGLGQSGGATDADSRVFITSFNTDNWQLEETLMASDLGPGKGMGFQLVMQGDVLLIHAHEYDSIFGISFPISTGVYVFENAGSGFTETQKLTENFHLFGQDFDYESDQIVVGAWGEQAVTQPGRIYVYEKDGSMWQNTQTINDSRNSNLGNQIEIFEDTMVAGNVQAGGVGAVTVFTKDSNNIWSETQFIQASDSAFNDQFGIAVRLDADEIIVGAGAGEDSTQTLGAVYTFSKDSSGQYIEQQKLVASYPTNLYDRFAGNLIFNDTDMLVNSISGGFMDADVTSFHHFSRGIPSGGGNTQYAVNSKVSGTWSSADADAQTLNIEVLQDGRAVIFASLNNNTENLWLYAVGTVANNIIDFETVYSTSGAQFGMNFNSNNVILKDEGDIQLSFNLCNQATFTYAFDDLGSNEVTLQKDKEIPGNECTNSRKYLPNGVSGAWFDVNRSGEGFTNYLYEENGVQKAEITWYTYDSNGKQMWLSGNGTVTDQSITITDMKTYAGANLFSGSSQSTTMGSLTMSWSVCHQANVDYDFSISGLGTGQFNLNQLTILDNTTCDLGSKIIK